MLSTPLSDKPNLEGKLCLVTGASSGLGKATATELAGMHAAVVIVCRSRDKGIVAREEIARRSGNGSVELMVADLSLMREVRRLASEYQAAHSRLHVLVNNAGSNFASYAETEERIERTIALNYFSPFLLTNLLLELLSASAPSRIVNVASASHFGATLDTDDLNGKRSRRFFGLRPYGRSKLALILFTYELARRLGGRAVTVNCLQPGRVRTNIWTHAGSASPLTRLATLFMASPEKGARTQVYLASSPRVEGVTGKYFDKMMEKRSSEASYDLALAGSLWERSLKVTGLAS